MTEPRPRYLFTSVPLQGHFFPTLCVAAALASRGADVTFAAYDEYREAVAAADAKNLRFRSLGPGPDPAAAAKLAAALGSYKKIDVPIERRAPRIGSIIFPFYEEHLFPPLLAVAKEMVAEAAEAAEAAAARKEQGNSNGNGGNGANPPPVVLVSEHASLAAHDVAEALSLPLALLWQLPLCYALAMGGEAGGAILSDARVPVELPGAVLPARMSLRQRLFLNPRLKRRQLEVLIGEYVPSRRAARARSGADALGKPAEARWKGEAPFAPAVGALPRRPLHVVSGTMLLEPEPVRKHALPDGWHLSGPQGVDLSAVAAGGGSGKGQRPHHPAVSALLAEAERAGVPVVYVAFGTLATFDDRPTIEAMARAFAALCAGGADAAAPAAETATTPTMPTPPDNSNKNSINNNSNTTTTTTNSNNNNNNNNNQKPACFVIWSLPHSGQALLPSGEAALIPPGIMHVLPSADSPAPSTLSPFLVVPRAEQQLLLSHKSVRLFVSHCGLNSKCEALVRGVAVVAWPLFADQFINASHVTNEGVGVLVPDDGADGDGTAGPKNPGGTRRDARAIERIVRGALADGAMSERAKALGERLRAVERSGADVAADILQAEFEGGVAAKA